MFALKGNQGTLRDDVELFLTSHKESPFKDIAVSRHQTLEKSHGRIESRAITALDQIDWLKKPTPSSRATRSVATGASRAITG